MNKQTVTELPLRAATNLEIFRLQAKELPKRLTKDESGEIGSWLLLAAGLAVAAAAAAGTIAGWIATHVSEIQGSSSGGPVAPGP